jgi:hypothetical protein
VSVEKGPISDFWDVDLDTEVLDKEFFYVMMDFTNLGPLPLEPSGITVSMTAYDTAGEEMTWLSIFGQFFPCERRGLRGCRRGVLSGCVVVS